MFSWFLALMCNITVFDYSALIDDLPSSRYCGGTVVEVAPLEAPLSTVEEIMGWDPEPYPSYFLVTVRQGNEPEEDGTFFCKGEIVQYEVGCWDRYFVYEGEGECLHDCGILRLVMP